MLPRSRHPEGQSDEESPPRPDRLFAATLGLTVALLLLGIPGCRGERRERPNPNLNVANKVESRGVTLYFESPELLLVPESRTVPLPQNEAAALSAVMRELLKGPGNASVSRLFPVDSTLRAGYLLPDGTAVVDLGGASLENGWNTGSHNELMAVYSVVQTLVTNFSGVRQVRLVVNGQPAETLAGHVRIDRPLRPMASLVPK